MAQSRKVAPPPLFVDTSICIARLFQGARQCAKIETRKQGHRVFSGLVSRQEFKRRVLRGANYLLSLLDRFGGFEETHHYLNKLRANPYHQRRAGICLAIMASITGEDDQDKADRLRTKARTLIVTGLRIFDAWLDELTDASGCWCGRQDVQIKTKTDREEYAFGLDECEKLPAGACGVSSFVASATAARKAITDYLATVPAAKKSVEIQNIEEFLARVEADPASAPSLNPCLKVGDLVIAMESDAVDAKLFYTMNGKESQHLCRALKQALIVRPANGLEDDVICPGEDPSSWPEF
jgi:hypothetical protein